MTDDLEVIWKEASCSNEGPSKISLGLRTTTQGLTPEAGVAFGAGSWDMTPFKSV
jgi:hypothetical protein